MKIIIDTREQKPLNFHHSVETEVRCLKTGDYSIEGYEDQIIVERKNPADLFGTLGKGHKRFKEEILRGQNSKYFLILVEGSFTKIRDKMFENAHYTKLRGDVVLKILFTLKFKYGVDFVFCNGPKESASYVLHLFKSWLKNNGDTRTNN